MNCRGYATDSKIYSIDLNLTNFCYIKIKILKTKSHGETPSVESTQLFINIVENFIRQHPTEIVGVHCTHGFNRTGFLICAYLVEKLDFSIDMAVALFAQCRSPGIYKQDYINELFRRYADEFNVRYLSFC